LQDHEKRKTRAYAEDISKYYNMKVEVFEDEQFYICHDGRELRHIRTETKEQNGYTRPLRYTAAPTAVDANIKPAVCINIMPKRILRKTR